MIETKLVDEMEKPKPNWSRGVIQHIVWSYTNSNVDTSEDRKKEGTYENRLLHLSLHDKEVIKGKVGYPITPGTLHPWLKVKESGIEGAGLGLFAARRFLPGNIIPINFAPTKNKNHLNSQSMQYNVMGITLVSERVVHYSLGLIL